MKVVDSNRFWLNVPHEPNTWLHIASIQHGVREFMYFADKRTSFTYIEEITGGHLSKIDDDSLFQELQVFLFDEGLSLASKPIFSDDDWLRGGNEAKTFSFGTPGKRKQASSKRRKRFRVKRP